MAVEKLLAIEVPERAVWIRMLMSELNRISPRTSCGWRPTAWTSAPSSMMIYGLRERELILAFFEKTAGLRMNLNYVRPGGVAADLPDGWEDDVEVICDTIVRARPSSTTSCLTGPADLPPAHGRRRRPSPPKRPWRSASPARCCARPACRGTCAAPCPTSPTTRSSST